MNDNDGLSVGLVFMVIGLVIIMVVVYLLVQAAMIVAVAGASWGGLTAVYNYGGSFKENIIDSNRKKHD